MAKPYMSIYPDMSVQPRLFQMVTQLQSLFLTLLRNGRNILDWERFFTLFSPDPTDSLLMRIPYIAHDLKKFRNYNLSLDLGF